MLYLLFIFVVCELLSSSGWPSISGCETYNNICFSVTVIIDGRRLQHLVFIQNLHTLPSRFWHILQNLEQCFPVMENEGESNNCNNVITSRKCCVVLENYFSRNYFNRMNHWTACQNPRLVNITVWKGWVIVRVVSIQRSSVDKRILERLLSVMLWTHPKVTCRLDDSQ